ncbi:MarR family transcriptional regulator [Ideonella azotifigens]|uniref:HTH marR-type domain-containing protein n=1 Tax=Ideonella azotifigens TaxID=513160 RepID=A0ABN1JY58_9BURK|nr:MarR family transcriptional regulator [Ideonella azotifigens]MCD2341365.1 MarR family transcriptional regulator [Ideonella azotifigens]
MDTEHGPTSAAANTASADWLALDHQLCFALYSTSLAMTKLYKPLLEPMGLTYPQYLVMLVLWEQKPEGNALTVSALGERLNLDSGTLTPLLKRLEAAGLITRQRDAGDERRVRVQPTRAGHQLREQALRIPPTVACAIQCELHEISQLTQRLRVLREQLLQAQA